jgi:hypothetical protein
MSAREKVMWENMCKDDRQGLDEEKHGDAARHLPYFRSLARCMDRSSLHGLSR